jgi:YlmC/YmxH family sporulation protein
MLARALDLRQKQVINITDGKRLGYVYDIEMDLSNGKVDSLIIPGEGKILGVFGKNSDYIIPWENIKKIGRDTILVEFIEDRHLDKKERRDKN